MTLVIQRRRRRRLRNRLLAATLFSALAVLALLAAGLAYYLLNLPGVGNAETRMQWILSEHHSVPGGPTPPAKLAEAAVATEDENFYANFAVNVASGAGRAALAALGTNSDPGGSTIPQQLASQLYGRREGVEGTLESIGLGIMLSLHFSKAELLSMYLNTVYYGDGYWGDVAAARGYFGASPRRLNWGEAAMLAGLPQAPSTYDPRHHPELAKLRQGQVLSQLVDNGALSRAGAEAILREPLSLRGQGSPPARGRRADRTGQALRHTSGRS